MEVRGVVNGVTVYDDFAPIRRLGNDHHGLRVEGGSEVDRGLEPRSNTLNWVRIEMRSPSHFSRGSSVDVSSPSCNGMFGAVAPLGDRAHVIADLDQLIECLATQAKSGDHVLIMSNGGFGGIHEKLLERLRTPPG